MRGTNAAILAGFSTGKQNADTNGGAKRPSSTAEELEQARRAALRQRYVRHRPLDLRLAGWLGSWIVTPEDYDRELRSRFPRFRRFRRFVAGFYPNMRSFLAAVLGPRVDPADAEERNQICNSCPVVRFRMPKRPSGRVRRFCGACNCPDWPLSELATKNKFANHKCPRGAHPTAPDWVDAWIATREGI